MTDRPRMLRRVSWAVVCAAAAAVPAACRGAAAGVDGPLDDMQRAVVESLAATERRTPAELLKAAIRAADVDATEAARGWFAAFVAAVDAAGEERRLVLADAGEGVESAGLGRLESRLGRDDPAARVVAEIRAAVRDGRRDPRRLEAAAGALASPVAATRLAAADTLAKAGIDALPVLVPLLDGTAGDTAVGRRARDLVALLGRESRGPLLDWLASDDVASWPGVIEALAASGADDVEDFLLAPALAADAPPAVRRAALRGLAGRAARDAAGAAPPRAAAERRLAARLDRILRPSGLPPVDPMRLEPVGDPSAAAAAFGGGVDGLVERPVWNGDTRRFDRIRMPPRSARARDALHVARDLAAIGTRDPTAVRLVMLARLEAALVASEDADALAPRDLRPPLAGPEGFTADDAADVLDEAIDRCMPGAAAAAATALSPPGPAGGPPALGPAARKALVRGLAVPDAGVSFAAARTLARAAGEPPFAGSSRVLAILAHAATATGVDRVVVAHPDTRTVDALATAVSRFGYEPVRVSTGREAILAAGERADTVLVLLAARLATPSAFETAQLLGLQGVGDPPAVLVVVDPLDDVCHGCFLSRVLATFHGMPRVAVVDRLDSLFQPWADEDGGAIRPPRFPDALARAAGPAAVDPEARGRARSARLRRAGEALAILSDLSRRGWDARPAAATALAAVGTPGLAGPAVELLGTLGVPDAQAALADESERIDLSDDRRAAARAALAASVERYGVLLACDHLRSLSARYTHAAGPSRDAAGSILELLDAAAPAGRGARPDAPHARPTR